jgi:hypothetical protein
MEIWMNRKAKIILKEGSAAMKEFGTTFWGRIKDITFVNNKDNQNLVLSTVSKLLFVQDFFGEESLIPVEEIENIQYL